MIMFILKTYYSLLNLLNAPQNTNQNSQGAPEWYGNELFGSFSSEKEKASLRGFFDSNGGYPSKTIITGLTGAGKSVIGATIVEMFLSDNPTGNVVLFKDNYNNDAPLPSRGSVGVYPYPHTKPVKTMNILGFGSASDSFGGSRCKSSLENIRQLVAKNGHEKMMIIFDESYISNDLLHGNDDTYLQLIGWINKIQSWGVKIVLIAQATRVENQTTTIHHVANSLDATLLKVDFSSSEDWRSLVSLRPSAKTIFHGLIEED